MTVAADFNPVTGARVRGDVWRGPLPRRFEPVDWSRIPEETRAHNMAVELLAKRSLGVTPGSPLHRLLTSPRMTRALRRRILFAVQAKPANLNRARAEKAIRSELQRLSL